MIVAYYRGYVVGNSKSENSGAMMAAGLSKESADTEIDRLCLTASIKVACINSSESVTISGDASGIDKMLAELTSCGISGRNLNTDGRAYHSHHMTFLGEEYEDLLQQGVGAFPMPAGPYDTVWISSVYAEAVSGKILSSYWRKNLKSPVRFSDALVQLLKGSQFHLVKIGSHSALEMSIKQACKKLEISDAKYHYSSVLSRGKNGVYCALNLMGKFFLSGHNISFAKVNHVETSVSTGTQGKVLTDLPPYPWTYDQTLFSESRSSRELRHRRYGHHDLLGIQTIGSSGLVTTWRNMLRVRDIPWVGSHRLGQEVVFPGAGYIAMAIEAICQSTGKTKADTPSFTLRHVNIIKALSLSLDENDPGVEIFTNLGPTKLSGTTNSSKWFDFEVSTYDNEKPVTHATGINSIETSIEPICARLSHEKVEFQELAIRNCYDRFAQVGLNFGTAFQSMEKIETDRKRELMCARSTVRYLNGGGTGGKKQSSYIMHPITIYTMLQVALVANSAGVISNLTCMVPTTIEHARFKAPTSSVIRCSWLVDAISEPIGPRSIRTTSELHDGQGQVYAQLVNVSAVAFQGVTEDESAVDERHPMMRVLGKPDITKLTSKHAHGFSAHLAGDIAGILRTSIVKNVLKMAAMVGMASHKNPRLNILELGVPRVEFTKRDVLRADTTFQRYASYSRGYSTGSSELFVEDVESVDSVSDNFNKLQPRSGTKYDLIIFPTTLTRNEYTRSASKSYSHFSAPRGLYWLSYPQS